MEETLGYEAFFSRDEWDAIDFHDGDLDVPDDFSPDGERVAAHEVTIYNPPGERADNANKFEVECDRCGIVGAADSKVEAEAIERLHTTFVARLVDNWEVSS